MIKVLLTKMKYYLSVHLLGFIACTESRVQHCNFFCFTAFVSSFSSLFTSAVSPLSDVRERLCDLSLHPDCQRPFVGPVPCHAANQQLLAFSDHFEKQKYVSISFHINERLFHMPHLLDASD